MRNQRGCEVFLMAESLIAKMVEFWGGLKKEGEWWRRSAIRRKPALRRALEALREISWCMGMASWLEFLDSDERIAEDMAIIPRAIEAAMYSGNQHQRE